MSLLSDLQILDKGTAYLTDAECVVIIIALLEWINLSYFRFVTGRSFVPASGPSTLCGLFLEVDPRGFTISLFC